MKAQVSGLFRALETISLDHHFHDQQEDEGANLEPLGLGSGPKDFSSLLLRRFPGARPSDEVEAWKERPAKPQRVPTSRAFMDMRQHRGECGVVELAGKAVGASFVGIVAACFAVSEAVRELHGGVGLDVVTFDLTTMDLVSAVAKSPANVISTPLRAFLAPLAVDGDVDQRTHSARGQVAKAESRH